MLLLKELFNHVVYNKTYVTIYDNLEFIDVVTHFKTTENMPT